MIESVVEHAIVLEITIATISLFVGVMLGMFLQSRSARRQAEERIARWERSRKGIDDEPPMSEAMRGLINDPLASDKTRLKLAIRRIDELEGAARVRRGESAGMSLQEFLDG